MNQRCYVSCSPVSCSATDGKRDTQRERERERERERKRLACITYPMLLDVCAWHLKPCCWKGEVLISIGLETTLTFNLTTLTSSEGQRSKGISLCWRPVSSSYLRLWGSQEVQTGPQCHSSPWQQDPDQSLVICLLPGLLLRPPPHLTPSHTNHPTSP